MSRAILARDQWPALSRHAGQASHGNRPANLAAYSSFGGRDMPCDGIAILRPRRRLIIIDVGALRRCDTNRLGVITMPADDHQAWQCHLLSSRISPRSRLCILGTASAAVVICLFVGDTFGRNNADGILH